MEIYRILLILISLVILYNSVTASGDAVSLFSSSFVFYAMLLWDYEKMKRSTNNKAKVRVCNWGVVTSLVFLALSFLGLTKMLVVVGEKGAYKFSFAETMLPAGHTMTGIPIHECFLGIIFITMLCVMWDSLTSAKPPDSKNVKNPNPPLTPDVEL